MDVSKELQEVISKNLPAAVGEVLQKRLAQAENDVKRLATLEAELVHVRKLVEERNNTNESLNAIISKHESLDKRVPEIETRERNIKVYELTKQLEAAEKVNTQIQSIVATVFKNPAYQESHFKTRNEIVNGYNQALNESETVTKYTT